MTPLWLLLTVSELEEEDKAFSKMGGGSGIGGKLYFSERTRMLGETYAALDAGPLNEV
jgi:hypothetical protein